MSALPRRSGMAPHRLARNRRAGLCHTSLFARTVIGRGRSCVYRTGASRKFMWLTTMISGPLSGTRASWEASIRHRAPVMTLIDEVTIR